MKKLWDIICPSQKDCPKFQFLTNVKLHSHYLVSGMDDGKCFNGIVNATKFTNEEWHCSDQKDMIWVFVVLGYDLKLFF